MPLTNLDLFCGAGGIAEGFRQAGFDSVFGNDMDHDALETFRANHPGAMAVEGPIEGLDAAAIRESLGLRRGELDSLVGGPPCQGFSINAPERFLDDPRNRLFRDYISFVDEFRPKTLMFENVPGMLSFGEGRVVELILESLRQLGYSVRLRVLLAAHYGVPQERWRVIILGALGNEAPHHPAPNHHAIARANFTGGSSLTLKTSADELPRHVSVLEAIGDLPPIGPGGGEAELDYASPPLSSFAAEMRQNSAVVLDHVSPRIAGINRERLTHIPAGGSWRDIPFELLPKGMKRARRSDHTRRYGRLHPDGLSGTVMTKMDPHWGPAFHYEQDRTLTVREAARLQSFPDDYTFTGSRGSQYQQIGNAVPVLLARAVARSLADFISGGTTHEREAAEVGVHAS